MYYYKIFRQKNKDKCWFLAGQRININKVLINCYIINIHGLYFESQTPLIFYYQPPTALSYKKPDKVSGLAYRKNLKGLKSSVIVISHDLVDSLINGAGVLLSAVGAGKYGHIVGVSQKSRFQKSGRNGRALKNNKVGAVLHSSVVCAHNACHIPLYRIGERVACKPSVALSAVGSVERLGAVYLHVSGNGITMDRYEHIRSIYALL